MPQAPKFTAIIPEMPPMIEPNNRSFRSVRESSNVKLSRIENNVKERSVKAMPITRPVKKPISLHFFIAIIVPPSTEAPFIISIIIVINPSLNGKNLNKNAKTSTSISEKERA